MKRILILLIAILCLSSFVSAEIDESDVMHCYDFETDGSDYKELKDYTSSGATLTSPKTTELASNVLTTTSSEKTNSPGSSSQSILSALWSK